jgi:regulator of nucleoside diphosphate kinase
MARPKIIITKRDYERLEALLESEFAKAIKPHEHLDDLRRELDRAEIVRPEDVPPRVVTMNSTVVLCDLDTKENETYTLVFPNAADVENDQLSVLAPVGTAILGERVGDVIHWRVPQGWRRLKVERVVYQPEREGAYHV